MAHGAMLRWLMISFVVAVTLTACSQVTSSPVVPTQTDMPAGATPSPTRAPQMKTPTPTRVTPTVTPTSAIQVRFSELKGQKIIFWHPYQGEAQNLLEKLTGQFNQENEWNITVSASSQGNWGSFEEQMRQVNGSNTQNPDILVGYNNDALIWDSGGWLLTDQADYVNDPLWGLPDKQIEAYFPAIWAQDFVPDGMMNGQAAEGGKRLGLPWYQSATLLLYNTSWAKDLGYKNPPRTLAEIQTQACAAAKWEPSGTRTPLAAAAVTRAGWLLSGDGSVFSSFVFAFGGEIARPDRSGYQFNTPESQKALEYLYRLYAGGCAAKSADGDMFQAFIERRALFITVSSAEVSAAQAAFAEAKFKDDWISLPFYSLEGQPVVDVYGPALLITQSNPARQLAAWLFVRWLVSPENQAAWAFTSGTLPVSSLAVQELVAQYKLSAPLRQALEFLPYAHPEPVYASWKSIRPAQAEALDYLLVPDLKPDAISSILKNMDQLAEEIHAQNR